MNTLKYPDLAASQAFHQIRPAVRHLLDHHSKKSKDFAAKLCYESPEEFSSCQRLRFLAEESNQPASAAARSLCCHRNRNKKREVFVQMDNHCSERTATTVKNQNLEWMQTERGDT